jgi:hypothetical protein
VQHVSYGPLIMSIMLIMSCYTGFFNVRRGWQSLNTGPRFYLRIIRRTGWLWIYTSRTTDGPSSRRSSRSHFYTPGLTPFRELVPLGRRNLVPILPPAHPLWGGLRYNWVSERITNKRKILRRSGEGEKGRYLPCKEEEGAYIFLMKQVPVMNDE